MHHENRWTHMSHEASETIRRMAVKRVLEGESPSAVMKSYGLCRTTIYPWLRAHKKSGEAALQSRPSTGRPPKLGDREKRQEHLWICGKDPRQYGFEFGLWTRRIVVDLVEQKFGKKLSVTAAGRLLAELEITPQKPLRRAYDPVAIAKWKEQDYPKLKARAKRLGANIFFIDEAGFRSDTALQRTWGAKGKTTIVATSGQRQRVNAISVVNNQWCLLVRCLYRQVQCAAVHHEAQSFHAQPPAACVARARRSSRASHQDCRCLCAVARGSARAKLPALLRAAWRAKRGLLSTHSSSHA
jgi:transposase